MFRCLAPFAATALLAGFTSASQESAAPKKADAVKEVERAFEEARARLEKDDAGLATRAAHRRIIEGIDKLLEDEGAGIANPPPAAPKGKQGPNQKSQAAPSTPKSNSMPMPMPKPGERSGVAPAGPWHPLRKYQQQALDAAGRERFVPRYEELLRAYYRSLAAGRGEEP